MALFTNQFSVAIFFILSLTIAAATQAATTDYINTTISHLEQGLKALQAGELEAVQEHLKAAGQSSKNIIGGSFEVKAQRGSRALTTARRLAREGDTDQAAASITQAIDIYKSLLSPEKSGGRGGLR